MTSSLVVTTVHPPRGCRRELGCILKILQMLHSRCHVKKTGIFGQRRREKAEHPLNALRGCNPATEHQTLHVICPSMSIIMQVLQISGKCFTAVSPLAIKLGPFLIECIHSNAVSAFLKLVEEICGFVARHSTCQPFRNIFRKVPTTPKV